MRIEDGGQPQPRKRRSEFGPITLEGASEAQSHAHSKQPRYPVDGARNPEPQLEQAR